MYTTFFQLILIVVVLCEANGNRYEGSWKNGVKNGSGKFFYLDKGQVYEGMWVDDLAKCGQMIDWNRDTAPDATQFPLPLVSNAFLKLHSCCYFLVTIYLVPYPLPHLSFSSPILYHILPLPLSFTLFLLLSRVLYFHYFLS